MNSNQPAPGSPLPPNGTSNSPAPNGFENAGKAGTVAFAGVLVIGLSGAITALLGGSALLVVLAVLCAAVPVAFWWASLAAAQSDTIEQIYRQSWSELEEWRNRWQTLQQEAHQTASALSLMRDGVVMLSESEQILLINPSARRLLGIRLQQDLFGRLFKELARHPDLSQAVTAARVGDGTQKIVLEISHGETIKPIKVRVDRFSSGSDNHLLITLRDETESYRVDAMRREFIANISHELKTPLAAIKGYAETVELAIKDDPDAAVHFMKQIHTQCLRLERLISDMMELARAQAGRGRLSISSVSLDEVIAESLKSYRPVAEGKGIALIVSDLPSGARVRSDSEATLTIANNLIGNAIHYTPEGGEVRVHCRRAGSFWAMVVEDTGVGIPVTEQKRIFERFYRVDKNRRGEDGGTGIGLSIVKNLTNTLGGEVRLHSQVGEGSKFEVLLPSDDDPKVD